jgi:DNA-binding response OmpR family regulator
MTATGERARRPRVLVVDDDPGLVLCLELVLRRAGLEPAVVGDGEAALGSVRRERPDLVLLDLDLAAGPVGSPGLGPGGEPAHDPGPGLIPLLREAAGTEEADASVPRVLVLAARGRPPDVARGLGLGADAFLAKPFATDRLLHTVSALLGGAT